MPDQGEKLTAYDSAVLIALMIEGRRISNPELKTRYGLDANKSRDNLKRLGYVTSDRPVSNGAYFHQLTDKGWRRCRQELPFADSSPRYMGAVLAAFHTAVCRDLAHHQRSMADLMAASMADETTSAQARPMSPDTAEGLPTRIRRAYAGLASKPGEWISLVDLRRAVNGADRSEVDAALRQLERDLDVNIVPESNRKILTEAQREAALRIGRQDKHFIAIGV